MPAVVERKPGLDPGVDLRQAAATLCTDVANAGRFAEAAGSLIRFVPEWGWLRWDGRRWARDTLGVVRKMAQDVHTFVRAEAAAAENPQVADALWKHAKYTAKSSAITAFLRETEPMCAERAEVFDRIPDRVNCRNCTLDFSRIDGDLPHHGDHSSANYLTRLIPHDWHLGARRVAWENFLEDVLPDAEVRAFVQRALGYSLLGHTREQCFFILHGTGCNGKSVFLNTIKSVLGEDYARQADPECFMAGRGPTTRNDLARLQGVRFVTAVESGDGHRLDESLIKSITGGDAVQARFLYREYFEFVPQFKLWLATNHPPRIRGTDHAIWRRVMLVPFTVTIPGDRRDPALQDTLLREAEGILDWLVGRMRRVLQIWTRPAAARSGGNAGVPRFRRHGRPIPGRPRRAATPRPMREEGHVCRVYPVVRTQRRAPCQSTGVFESPPIPRPRRVPRSRRNTLLDRRPSRPRVTLVTLVTLS